MLRSNFSVKITHIS